MNQLFERNEWHDKITPDRMIKGKIKKEKNCEYFRTSQHKLCNIFDYQCYVNDLII